MYYIKKYIDGWAIHNDDSGAARLLTEEEIEAVKKELPDLQDDRVLTLFIEDIKCIKDKP